MLQIGLDREDYPANFMIFYLLSCTVCTLIICFSFHTMGLVILVGETTIFALLISVYLSKIQDLMSVGTMLVHMTPFWVFLFSPTLLYFSTLQEPFGVFYSLYSFSYHSFQEDCSYYYYIIYQTPINTLFVVTLMLSATLIILIAFKESTTMRTSSYFSTDSDNIDIASKDGVSYSFYV